MDDALGHFGVVEHGLGVLRAGEVEVVEHKAEVAVFGDGLDGLGVGVVDEPEVGGAFAAAEIRADKALTFAGAALEHGGVFGRLFVGAGLAGKDGVIGAEPIGGLGVDFGTLLWRNEIEVGVNTIAYIAKHEGGALDAVINGVDGGFTANGADLVATDVNPVDWSEDVDTVNTPLQRRLPQDC